MKKYIKVTNVVLIILLILQIVFPVITNIDISYAAAITYTEGGVTYSYSNNSNAILTITASNSGRITSNWKNSEQLKGYVTSIKRVNIQSTIVSIGDYAFSGCTSLTTVCIGNGASDYVEKLKTLNGYINYAYSEQKGLETIGNYAFFGCTSLSEFGMQTKIENLSGSKEYNRIAFNMLNYNTRSIGNYAFSGCTRLEVFTLNENIAYSNIGMNAFEDTTIVRYAENKFRYNNRIGINKSLTVNVPIGGKTQTKTQTLIENMTFLEDDKIYIMTSPGTCQHTINSIKITLTNRDTQETKEWTVRGAGSSVETTIPVGLLRYDCVMIPKDGNYKIDAAITCKACDDGSNSSGAEIQYLYISTREYPVTYNGNESTGGNTESQTKIHNVDLTLNNNGFSKTGYTFNNWNTTANGTGTTYFQGSSYTNNEALTLYAQWERNNYQLEVRPNGGTWNNSANNQSFTIAYEGTKNIALPTKTGYSFTGWTLTGTGSTMSSLTANNATFTMGTANATLTANWRINSSTLQVNPAGGSWNNSTEVQNFTQNYNTTKGIPVPTREGYTFKGWTRTGTNGSLSSTTSAATYTFGASNGITDIITATWQKNQYQLEVKPNGGEWKGNNQNQKITIDYGGTEVIPVPSRTGYSFTKWELAGEGSKMSSLTANNATFTMGASNATLTANWERNSYQLEVRPNGGTWNNSTNNQPFTIAYEGTKSIGLPKRIGYTFKGWTLAGEGSKMSSLTANNATFTMGASNATLTANWDRNNYQLEVRPNGGTWNNSTSNQPFTIAYEGTKSIRLPIRTGYTFKGWTLEGAESTMSSLTEDNATFTMGTENATLTANWEKNNYQLEVRPNGGMWKESIESGESAENQNFTLSYEGSKQILLPRRNGYKFTGWTLEGEGSAMSSLMEDNATFKMGYANAILTANWELIKHDITGTVTWNDEEDKYVSRPSEVEITLNSDEEVTEIEQGALETSATKTVPITRTTLPYGFENLQTKKIKDDTNYYYTVSQNKVAGYETIINGYDIINHLILPSYTSQVVTTPRNKVESEFVKNEEVQVVGMITASNNNRNKVGTCKEEVNFEIDSGIEIDKDSIKISYIDKEGNRKEIIDYIVEDNTIKVSFEKNREEDDDETAGDSIKIELNGIMQEVKEYTNTISYTGYLRDYETGEDTNINLGTLTTTSENITVGKVSISIKEINEENEITTGSHFEIRKKETGEVVQSFITKGKLEAIRKLEPIIEYVVIETKPIPGYTTAKEATFMLNKQGEIIIENGAEKEENTIIIRDYKTRLQVQIRDELSKEYVTGPRWQVIRKTEENGQIKEEIVAEWTSEGKEHQIEKLPIGEYTLREVSIGEDTGYVTIGDITFNIEDTKELQILEVEQKVSRLRVHLKDIETENYVEGAILQIIKRTEEDGKVEEKVVREWVTEEGGNLELKLPIGDYIIREIKLPEHSGYATIEDKLVKVVDTLEEQQVELKQGYTKVKIEIIDEETKEKIDNVEVEIINKETGDVIKLTETKEGYEAERLPIGDYIIREKTPDGYKEVEETKIKVKDTIEIQTERIEHKRLIYDMQVEKELTSITIDGEKKIVPKGELQKVEVKESKIKTADIRLEYIIRVSNVGETKATIGTIIDNIPEGFKLVSTDWKQEGRNATYNAEKEELQPSESKEVRILLKWENNESNFGEKKNTAQLQGSTNPYDYQDKTTENNIGEEITIFSIKTGQEKKVIMIKIITIIILVSVVICFIAQIEIAILKRSRRY